MNNINNIEDKNKDEEEVYSDEFDKECYRDDNDRYELSLLSEFAREYILSSRFEKRRFNMEAWFAKKEYEKRMNEINSSSTSTFQENNNKN